MKLIIAELIEYLGACELVRIMDDKINELCFCAVVDIPNDVKKLFVKNIYSHNGVIYIITTLDKRQIKCYNNKKCGVAKRQGTGL